MAKEKRYKDRLTKAEGLDVKKKIMEMILSEKPIEKNAYLQLQKDYNLSQIAIYRHVQHVCSEIEPEIIEGFKWNFDRIFRKIQEKAEQMVDDSESHEDLRRSIDTMVKVIKERTDFLERFSIKEKVADKVVVSHEISDLDKLSQEILEGEVVEVVNDE